MKLFVSIFLIFSHLFSTVGFSMEVHECAGKKSYSIYGISLHNLCGCEHDSKEHSKDCCKDKKTVIKADNKDKQSNKVIASKNPIEPIEISQSIVFVDRDIQCIGINSLAFGTKHPPDHSPPLYILYSVFLI